MTSACHKSKEPQTTSIVVSVLEFFCCLWKTAVKTSILLKETVKPPLKTQIKKRKKKSPQSHISEYKIQKAVTDLFCNWLFINFSCLPNLSVF